MRTDIIEYLKNDLKTRCKKDSNFFGMSIYYHVKSVSKKFNLSGKNTVQM